MPTAPVETKEKIEKPAKEPERKLSIKIGADPEFLMFHGTKAINAQSLMNNFMKSKTGLRHGNLGYTIPSAGEVGWDGASSTGEIRPLPSNSPEGLTKNIGILLKTMHKYMPFLDYTTLSIGNPIGGHLHLDVEPHLVARIGTDYEDGDFISEDNDEEPSTETNTKRVTKKQQQAEMNRITKLLATFVMPIVASEHRVSSTGRLAGNYGKADDIRWDKRDGQGTLEIRGMSAEWLTSEKTTLSTIAYFAVVMNEVSKHNKELIKAEGVLKTKGHINAIQLMMLSDYSVIENAVIRSLTKTIKEFELYPQFKEEVDFIMDPKAVMAEKEKHGWTLNSGWNLGNQGSTPTKKDIFSTAKINKKLKSADHVALEEGLTVPYNDDYNVQLFARAITDRIATLNWKLNNEYFLFGLKKGIKGYIAMKCKENTFYTIPENGNHSAHKATCEKMSQKFHKYGQQIRIDPKTGKTRRWGINQIIIGIPYNPRVENDPKQFLELIWELEKGKMEAKNIDHFKTVSTEEEVDVEELVKQASGNNVRGANPSNNTIVNVNTDLLERINEPEAN